MKLELLERKVMTVGRLLNRPKLGLGSLGRRYRVEDHAHGEDAIFGPVYFSAQELWDRMDVAETALRLLVKPTPASTEPWTTEEILAREG